MKTNILIISSLIISTINLSGQPYRITRCDYNGLYEQMFRYIYVVQDGELSFWADVDPYEYKYVVVRDMLSGKELLPGDDIPDNVVLGFTPTTIHPAHTSLVLKSGNDCELIYSFFEYQTIDYSYVLYQQLSQAYEFISNHESQMDSDVFPSYAKVICDVFVGNSRYLE